MKILYLLLDIGTLAFPLARSFEARVRYVDWWPGVGLGILFTCAFFIPTDAWFTDEGIWAFSADYTLPYRLLGLPMEEWLFFIVVPFACGFIYACVDSLLDVKDEIGSQLFAGLLVLLGAWLSLTHTDKAYTFIKVGAASVTLSVFMLATRGRGIGKLMVAYLLTEIPFLIVNGVLTYMPVVTYNDSENVGVRMSSLLGIAFFNIPVEDNFYSLMMLTLTVAGMRILPQKGKQ